MPSRTHIPALFSSSSCVISLARLLEQGGSDDCRKIFRGYQRTRKMDAKHGKIFRVALHRSLPKTERCNETSMATVFFSLLFQRSANFCRARDGEGLFAPLSSVPAIKF